MLKAGKPELAAYMLMPKVIRRLQQTMQPMLKVMKLLQMDNIHMLKVKQQ